MTAQIFNSYQNWLKVKSYSDATIRNYLSDLRKYFLFTNSGLDQISNKIFNQDNLSSYFQNINQDQNYKRFLASLSKFFEFAIDQKLISQNPFTKAQKNSLGSNIYDLKTILELYQQQLIAKKSSLSTIRNYINDIHQFINWASSEPK
jgi:site-specific recombinase XerD